MEKDPIMTENSQKNDTTTVNSEKSDKQEEKTEHWDGVLTIDPLTVRRIIEANKYVDDLEEAGEL
jgi:hypothetical protein